jgi:hypothetical protein
LTCEYLREFSTKFEMILMLLSGAWKKMIHEKNLKQKISWHCPFKHNATKSVNRSILKKSRHIGFGVFIVRPCGLEPYILASLPEAKFLVTDWAIKPTLA